MRTLRLTHALDVGAFTFPQSGSILVLRPRLEDNLHMLSREQLEIVTGFKPDFDFFQRQGYKVLTKPTGGHSVVLVCVPRTKEDALDLIACAQSAVVAGGLVIVDGQKTDGIDSLHREMRAKGMASEALSKAHGKLFTFQSDLDLSDWRAPDMLTEDGFLTKVGIFSPQSADRGSVMLAAALPNKLGGHVVDLGAGWGYLSRHILTRDSVKHLDLVEAEVAALDCARKNITDPRAAFIWADARSFKPIRSADAVVCNPPFHVGREANPALGMSFISAAAAMLSPGGTLWLVANRHLPYTKHIATLFRDVEDLGGDGTFRLTRAARPVRQTPTRTGA